MFSPAISSILDQCPASLPVGRSISTLATILMSSTLSTSKNSVSAMFTNLSLAPSSNWYFNLSPFESIMLGIIILKLFLLRYLTILPIDINSIAESEFFNFGKRRRREAVNPKILKEKERLAEIMFTVIRRLDMQDCLLRTLCELQVRNSFGTEKLSREIKLTLSALSKSGWKRKAEEKPNTNPDVIEERPILSVFEEAVQIGWEAKSHNGSECQERYFICPLTGPDIIQHFNTVNVINVL